MPVEFYFPFFVSRSLNGNSGGRRLCGEYSAVIPGRRRDWAGDEFPVRQH